MEIISGFLLLTADVMGVKWVRNENNRVRKAIKLLTFLVAGIIGMMLYFTIFG